jgi:hypothetical protein
MMVVRSVLAPRSGASVYSIPEAEASPAAALVLGAPLLVGPGQDSGRSVELK